MKTIILDNTNIAEFYTKAGFKKLASYHCYTGIGIKFHAIYWDYSAGIYGDDKKRKGYKYCFAVNAKGTTKKVFFDMVYNHLFVAGEDYTPWLYIKTAKTDANRFKPSLSLDIRTFN